MNASRIGTAIIASVLLLTAPLHAGSVSVPMRVSVQVVARAIVNVDAQQTVTVTQSDLDRGYVEVRTTLRAKTNSRRGYLLQVEKTSDDFRSIAVELPNASINIASHESWIERPYVPGGEVVPLRARLYLAPGARVGQHALPLAFSATPL